MYFRFGAALALVVLVSMAGVVLEKQTLRMRRDISRQYYQTDILLDLQVSLRLRTQRLTSPTAVASASASGDRRQQTPEPAAPADPDDESRNLYAEEPLQPRLPLLRFQQPFNPQGID